MAGPQPRSRASNGRKIAGETLIMIQRSLVLILFAPHFRVYRRGTYWPLRRMLDSGNEEELRQELTEWCKYKENEAGYVQVAGAVIFASVTSCLSWNALDRSHWSGPALWYGTIALALSCIFTGAQQSLVIPQAASIEKLSSAKIGKIKESFVWPNKGASQPSFFALFAWQLPVMLLGYAVLSFLAGLCAVVLSPMARNPEWNDEAKIATYFIVISVFSLICWLFPSAFVHQIGSIRA